MTTEMTSKDTWHVVQFRRQIKVVVPKGPALPEFSIYVK